MKSVTMPSQKMVFLGVVVDTTSMEVRLPEQKLQKIHAEARSMTHLTMVSARAVTRLIGKMSAASHAVSPFAIVYRHLQVLVSSTVNNRLLGDSETDPRLSGGWSGRTTRCHSGTVRVF